VIAVDDENGNHEGDLIMAATLATPQAIAFMIRHGSGIVSVGMKEEDLERLRIPMMSPITEIADLSTRASTVTVVCIEFQVAQGYSDPLSKAAFYSFPPLKFLIRVCVRTRARVCELS